MSAVPDAPQRPWPVRARRSSGLWLAMALAFALGASVRELNHARIPAATVSAEPSAAERPGWFSVDPDGLYHARRLERALDEGRVAATDSFLNHPEGAAIPWPPYYTHALWLALGPFAPTEAEARHAWLERAVATVPQWLAALSCAVVAAAAWRFGGTLAAGVAGASFALLGASLDYSVPGIGDHHAFATLLAALVLALTSLAFAEESERRGRALLLGAIVGALAGLLEGAWVGGLVHVALVQGALGILIVRHARRPVAGLAAFGLSFHVALALALLPAVRSSPWRALEPWMVINLSWFHLAHALLGGLVFAPLAWLAPGGKGARRYPLAVAGALALLALVLGSSDVPLARAVRDGFAWAGRSNEFMAYITESQPLLWGQIGGPDALHAKLGHAAWLAPLAWIWLALRAWRGELGLWVWVVALPPMLAQALVQRRFAEVFGVPLAVALGVGAASLVALLRRRSASSPATGGTAGRSEGGGGGGGIPMVGGALGPGASLLLATGGLALGALGQAATVEQTWMRARAAQGGGALASAPAIVDQQSFRALLDWIRARTEPGAAVLAAWELGHGLEWVAERPSIATNFGSYVGLEGYLAPWRFFLAEDPVEAEAILASRDARYVMILGRFSNDLEVMLELLRPGERQAFRRVPPSGPPVPTQRWFTTMAARLMLTGKVGDPEAGALTGDSLDFVRLVHVSPSALRMPMAIPHTGGEVPAGWVWERVAGAQVTARGAPGERLELAFDVEYPGTGRKLLWSAGAGVGSDGLARVRVPYASDAPNGDGRAGPIHWRLGGRAGELAIPEQAVLTGSEVSIP